MIMNRQTIHGSFTTFLVLAVFFLFAGCGKSQIDNALESDANGYFCAACAAKFYTDHSVFPTTCPKCKSGNIVEAVGYICKTDHHVTLAPRGRDLVNCEKCGVQTSSRKLPSEADLKTSGAVKVGK